jgi:sigma-B regulation protein RsbU (phosphoserine phosphatase)
MSIFKKLLIILLTVSLPPLVFVSALDKRATESLSRDLILDHRAAQIDQARQELARIVAAAGALLEREREIVRLALADMAARPTAPRIAPSLPGDGLVRRQDVLPRHGGAGDAAADPDPASEAWFQEAARSESPLWSLRSELLTGAMATADGRVAVIDLKAEALLDRAVLPPDWGDSALVTLTDPRTGRIVAQRGRAPAKGEEVLSAEGPAGPWPLTLRVAVPGDTLLARTAQSEQRARKRLANQMKVAATSVVVFGLVAIILSFLGSRAVTKPVVDLTRTARRVAEGDLEARADIRTGDELEDLGESFNAMIPKLQDRFRMREALSLAMEVQQHLLPEASPALPGFDVAGRSIYCDETGGDYYDFIEFSQLDPRHLGVAVGDVTGHGVAAALLMTTARALLRSQAATPGGLSDLMTSINHHLSQDTHAGRFMTLFYGVVEAETRRFRWVSAGHEPALLYNPESDTFFELAGSDIPLGIDANWRYHEDSRDDWHPGEIVTIGTDGIWESRNPRGEMFGKDALKAVIRKHAHQSADEICDAIARALGSFRQDRAQEDDITLVVIKAAI